jgi:hypothetical protein
MTEPRKWTHISFGEGGIIEDPNRPPPSLIRPKKPKPKPKPPGWIDKAREKLERIKAGIRHGTRNPTTEAVREKLEKEHYQ